MEDVLTTWLLENRPYTHLHTRVRQFLVLCKKIEPELSYTKLKNYIVPIVNKLMAGDVGRLWIRDRCYERVLRLYGQNDQRSSTWHAKRNEMITASEVYKVFGTEESRRELMMRKLEPTIPSETPSNPVAALVWGTRFEPVAKRIYEKKTHCSITDVSCAQHPVYKFLGASPDGLIVPHDDDERRYGRLVEFKCPMSRAEKPEIPPAYVHQMQMQMECTGIDECEYVEFRFKQVTYNEWKKFNGEKGFFSVHESGKVEYDVSIPEDDYQVIYWVLNSMKQDYVPKDPNWLSTYLPQLQSFWDQVEEHKKNGTRPPEKKLPSLEL